MSGRVHIPGFIGPSNVLRTTGQDKERTVNLYIESPNPGTGKTEGTVIGTPCLRPFVMLGAGTRVRGLFEQDGRAFGSTDEGEYEIFSGATATRLGSIVGDDLPVSKFSNGSEDTPGHQVMTISGGFGYVMNLNTNVFGIVTAPDFPEDVIMGDFLDGYGIVLVRNSRQFNLSALFDLTSYDALDVGERSEGADNIVSFKRFHREAWFPGSKTGEVWTNRGDALFPLAPVPGVFLEQGSDCPFGIVRMDNSGIWVGKDEHGHRIVYRANGYTPERISTHAVELALSRSTSLATATAFAYQDQGHLYYWLYVPDLLTCFIYDANTKLWHERALFVEFDENNDPVWEADRAYCHCFAFGKHLVGDRASGMVYEMNLDFYSDYLVN